ncbi:hypothetical protein KIN20_020753 [Parelaphostrongylus tenuis]|uniref:Uncharacterized protein n=1 Tax=Parelaphostrongylus tenuis TaxID=148309 RepID=A0AAD5MMY4_PARTN|nr:hypothetical protein KIN20_020753 [Parelaphostrongylus tenuis]
MSLGARPESWPLTPIASPVTAAVSHLAAIHSLNLNRILGKTNSHSSSIRSQTLLGARLRLPPLLVLDYPGLSVL